MNILHILLCVAQNQILLYDTPNFDVQILEKKTECDVLINGILGNVLISLLVIQLFPYTGSRISQDLVQQSFQKEKSKTQAREMPSLHFCYRKSSLLLFSSRHLLGKPWYRRSPQVLGLFLTETDSCKHFTL